MLQGELSRLSEITNSLAIFCMATYGEGDPTDNAQDFYDWLQENDDEDLSGLNYTVSLYVQVVFAWSLAGLQECRDLSLSVGTLLVLVLHKQFDAHHNPWAQFDIIICLVLSNQKPK